MAFEKGTFTAPDIEVAPCGLLSVARVTEWSTGSEPWIRGYEYEVLSTPTVRILNVNNATVTDGELPGGGGDSYHEGQAFFIEVEKKQSGMGIVGTNPLSEAREEILAATQKAAEYELWEGVAIRAGASPANYLIKQNGATVVTSSGIDAAKALRALEQAISLSPVGGRGIIHVTRDVASELGNRLLYKGNGDSATDDRAITRLGTRVVIGSGYTGNGPVGATGRAASATNKWMFATSAIDLELGEPVLVTSSLADGFVTSTNDSTVVIQRAGAVHFDPSIWYAAQVTLS